MSADEKDARLDAIDELLQHIIATVARKNFQGVRRDDPVMILPTIMKVLADDAAEQHDAVLKRHAEAHEDIALRWRIDANESAQRIMSASLAACRKQIEEAAAHTAKDVREAIKAEMAVALGELRAENEAGQKTHGPLMMAGGALAFLGGAAALAAVVLKLI